MNRLDLSMSLLLLLLALQGYYLRFAKDDAILSYLGFQCLQALGEDLQVMSLPHATNISLGDEDALLAQLIAGANLSEGRLLKSYLYGNFFNLRVNTILGDWFSAACLLQRHLSSGIIKFL
jgi:hypothetical protein